MLQDVKKGLAAGLGAVVLSRDKIEEITRKLVSEARLSPEDAGRLCDDLIQAGESQWTEMEGTIREALRKGRDGLDIAGKAEFERLREAVEDLEQRIRRVEESRSEPEG